MSAAGIEWAASHSWERSTNELRMVLAGTVAAHRRGELPAAAPPPGTPTTSEPVEDAQIANVG